MNKLVVLCAATLLLGAIGGCAGSQEAFVYGSEVMTVEEVAAYRTFLVTAEGDELTQGITEHYELVEARAAETDTSLKTEAQARPQRQSSGSTYSASTSSRLGRSGGSRTVAGVGGTAGGQSATPD